MSIEGQSASSPLVSEEDRNRVIGSFRTVNDFPTKGIEFVDIMPIFYNPEILEICLTYLENVVKQTNANTICAPDSRGFMFGCPLASRLKLKFVPARKAGKLPGACFRRSYNMEYAESTGIEIQQGALVEGDRVLIVDDIVATGGTVDAVRAIIENDTNATIAGAAFISRIPDLPATINIPKTYILTDPVTTNPK